MQGNVLLSFLTRHKENIIGDDAPYRSSGHAGL